MNGAQLQAIRQSFGLSQEALAYELGVSVMTVSRWERGLHRIPHMVERLFQAKAIYESMSD